MSGFWDWLIGRANHNSRIISGETEMFAIPALLQILPSLAGALASTMIKDKDVLQWVDLALGIIGAGVAVPAKLSALDAEIAGFVARNEAPPDAWWAEYRARSDDAHGDIGRAGRGE